MIFLQHLCENKHSSEVHYILAVLVSSHSSTNGPNLFQELVAVLR